jgi:hypothetical protein
LVAGSDGGSVGSSTKPSVVTLSSLVVALSGLAVTLSRLVVTLSSLGFEVIRLLKLTANLNVNSGMSPSI